MLRSKRCARGMAQLIPSVVAVSLDGVVHLSAQQQDERRPIEVEQQREQPRKPAIQRVNQDAASG